MAAHKNERKFEIIEIIMSYSLLLHKPIVQKLIDVYTEEKFEKFPKDFLTFFDTMINRTEEKSISSQAAFLRELIYWELRFCVEYNEDQYLYMHDVNCKKLKLEAIKIVTNELVNLGFKLYICLIDDSRYVCQPFKSFEIPDWMEIDNIGIAKLEKRLPKKEHLFPCSLTDRLINLYSSNFNKFPDDIVDIFDNKEHPKNISGINLLRHEIYLAHKFYRNFIEIDIDVSLPNEEVYLVIRELLELGLTLKLKIPYRQDMIITMKDFDKITNRQIRSINILSLTN